MNRLIISTLVLFAACTTETPPTGGGGGAGGGGGDGNEVYQCNGVAVCNGVETTYPGSLCTDAAGAQDQVDNWTSNCEATYEANCSQWSCNDTCTPTGDSC